MCLISALSLLWKFLGRTDWTWDILIQSCLWAATSTSYYKGVCANSVPLKQMYFSIGYISTESFINFFKGESVGEIRTTEWKVWPANFTMVMTPVIFLASTVTDLPQAYFIQRRDFTGAILLSPIYGYCWVQGWKEALLEWYRWQYLTLFSSCFGYSRYLPIPLFTYPEIIFATNF